MTIKELAEVIGVSKVAVNNKLVELDLKDKLTKQGNKFIVSDEIAEEVKQAFRKKERAPEEPEAVKPEEAEELQADYIATLKEELKEKNEQIAELQRQMAEKDKQMAEQIKAKDEQIADFLQVMKQSNYLLAESKQDPHTYEAENFDIEIAKEEKSGGIFSKLFRKRS